MARRQQRHWAPTVASNISYVAFADLAKNRDGLAVAFRFRRQPTAASPQIARRETLRRHPTR